MSASLCISATTARTSALTAIEPISPRVTVSVFTITPYDGRTTAQYTHARTHTHTKQASKQSK